MALENNLGWVSVIIRQDIGLLSLLLHNFCMKNIIKTYDTRWRSVLFPPVLKHILPPVNGKTVGGSISALTSHVTHISE